MTKDVAIWNAAQLIEELTNNGFARHKPSQDETAEAPEALGDEVQGTESQRAASQDFGTLADDIIAIQQKQELPLTLRILVAIGAFFASIAFFLCIGSILYANKIDMSTTRAIFIGAFLIVAAIDVQKIINDDKVLRYHFFE